MTGFSLLVPLTYCFAGFLVVLRGRSLQMHPTRGGVWDDSASSRIWSDANVSDDGDGTGGPQGDINNIFQEDPDYQVSAGRFWCMSQAARLHNYGSCHDDGVYTGWPHSHPPMLPRSNVAEGWLCPGCGNYNFPQRRRCVNANCAFSPVEGTDIYRMGTVIRDFNGRAMVEVLQSGLWSHQAFYEDLCWHGLNPAEWQDVHCGVGAAWTAISQA